MHRYSPGAPSDAAPPPEQSAGNSRGRTPKISQDDADTWSAGPVGSEPSVPEEDPLVLDEIDRIISELQTKRGEPGPPTDEPRPWNVPEPRGEATFGNRDEPGTLPSGYFEEHLEAARNAVGEINQQVGDLQRTSATLRQRVAAAETELDRITREYQFVRNRSNSVPPATSSLPAVPLWSEGEPDPPNPSQPLRGSALSSGSFTAIRAASSAGPPPVYEAFTVDRYNRTIDSLKGSRTQLVAWTLLLSALIGIVLVLVVLYSPVVHPPIWVAVLPLVWIVPIPYFLLSFRGTQRVLQRNHLNLPEAR